MVRLLLNSGLLSVALWAALLTFLAVLVAWLRARATDRGRAHGPAVPPFLATSLFLTFLAAGMVFNLGYGLYRWYVSPRDGMQDVVSAQEFLAGRSLFPERMNDLMRQTLEREPRRSPLWWSSGMREREAEARATTYREHWVQAHPPLMTLLVAPFVAAGGVLGAQVAVLVLSLAGLALALILIGRGLGWRLSRRHGFVLVLGLLAAEPVVNTLRSGQSGLLLCALMVVGWYALRHDRPVLAGVSIALATGLKLFPGLLLIYLLLRHRRAFVAASATVLLLVVLIGVLTGWHTFGEYLDTTRGVVPEYARYPGNLSLLGLVARPLAPEDVARSQVLFYGLALAVLAAVVWVVRQAPAAQPAEADIRTLDVEYALFIALMPLLSPISWDHYLSILLLPMAVLGNRALTATAPWSATLGFLGILVVLCVPDTSFTWVFQNLHGGARSWAEWLFLPLRTYALAALCTWLAVLLARGRGNISAVPPGAVLAGLLLVLGLAQVLAYVPSEPFFNGDETRHVMTGVYVRDVLRDRPLTDLRDYTVRYYAQYPALGLLVWPPFFYFMEGVFMLVFGTCFLAARVLVGLFAAMACSYLFLLATRTHGRKTAALAVLLFGLSPLVFAYAGQVMLEVPALALSLMAIYHCQRYLDGEHRRDLALCCLATALAALTRFDGVYLAPLFFIWLAGSGRLRLLRRRDVLVGMVAAVLLVAPFYLLTAHYVGGAHLQAVREGTGGTSTHFLGAQNLFYYPAHIPEQTGWLLVVPALVGLAAALRPANRAASWPYLAMMTATYLTFTPMAELEARHAIYWIPALAVFAGDGCRRLATVGQTGKMPVPRSALACCIAGVVVIGTAWPALRGKQDHVRGYEAAARYVVGHNIQTPVCLFDGFLTGDFIYQVRRLDPERRLGVLRGDKLFYGVLSDPHGGYREWARNRGDILALIFKLDPELIVVEDPQIYFEVPIAAVLRETLKADPARFRLEKVILIDSSLPIFQKKRLLVYRNLLRNPHREENLEIRMLSMDGILRPR